MQPAILYVKKLHVTCNLQFEMYAKALIPSVTLPWHLKLKRISNINIFIGWKYPQCKKPGHKFLMTPMTRTHLPGTIDPSLTFMSHPFLLDLKFVILDYDTS